MCLGSVFCVTVKTSEHSGLKTITYVVSSEHLKQLFSHQASYCTLFWHAITGVTVRTMTSFDELFCRLACNDKSCAASEVCALIPFAKIKHTAKAQAGLRHTSCDTDAECPCSSMLL